MSYGEDPYEYRERLLWEADRYDHGFGNIAAAIRTLRELYLSPTEESTPVGRAMAADPKCLDWMHDYWEYVKWNEHGNQCNLSEIGFDGFVDAILDPGNVLEYLLPEGRIPEYKDAIELADRLLALHEKYVPTRNKNRRGRR